MLVGTYNYLGHIYDVEAYDFGDSLVGYLNPRTSADKMFLDSGIHGEDFDMPAQWDRLYFKIGLGAVYVSCYIYEDIDSNGNKIKYKNEVNSVVFQELGSIIRGMKNTCNKNNRVSDELYANFNPSRVMEYSFPQGSMKLEITIIREVQFNNGNISLSLSEDGDYSNIVNKPTNTNHKFSLDLSEFISSKDEGVDWDFGTDDTIFSLNDIIEANPDKSYIWLRGRKYTIVKTTDEVVRICKQIWNHDGIVAFDTETTGLNINITSRQGIGDRLVGMVFSITPGEAWYFPIRHKKIKNICTEANEVCIIDKYFKPILEKKKLLCHNGSFDWKVMYNYGIFINLVEDTYILFKVTVWNDHRDMLIGLKSLTHTFLDRDSFELSDFVRGKFGSNNIKFWDLEEESVKYYACPDTDNLIELFQYCIDNDLLAKYGAKKIYQIEVAFSLVIAYQEYYGHCVDISKIDDLVRDIISTKETEYAEMVKIVGHDFNPRSSRDLLKVMYEELGYPIYGYTKTGNPSCDKDIRKKLMEESDIDGNPKYPFACHLSRYLDSCTLESNFTKNINKFATEDGLMFSEVQQFLETGRVSVKNPNYQSYSDVVKKYIIPRQGYFALDADYSSVEARIMVSMAGCKDMVEKMKDPDTDYHTIKASQMFGIPYEMVTHKQRKISKGVNFGLLYGMGDASLAARLFGEKTPENIRKAKKQKELYFMGIDELRSFIDKSRAQGVTQYYSTTYFGRRRYYDPRKVRKDSIERQSCNARIQGTAADIYKIAMIRLLHQLRKRGWLGKVLISAFIHDECFLEISKSLDPIVVLKVLRDCMMLNNEGWCPLFIGAGFGRNWYEAKNTEIPVQVQDSLIDRYGESGLGWWSGDTNRLCSFIVDEINLYDRDRVLNYLKDENNKGKVLSPAVNSLAHDVVDAIIDGAEIEGCVDTKLERKSDTLDNLLEFGKAFNCIDLIEKAEVKRPIHTEVSVMSDLGDDSVEESSEDDKDSWKDTLKLYINTVGCYCKVDYEEGIKIFFRFMDDNPMFMNELLKFFKKHEGNVDLFAVKNGNEIYSTGIKVDRSIYPKLVKIYTSVK